MKPQRIQLRRTKGWRKPEGAIVVARPSRWGNPFYMRGKQPGRHDGLVYMPGLKNWVNTREEAVEAYWWWLTNAKDSPSIVSIIDELRGHDLACWCPLDQPCHADVLLELANP